MATCNKATSPQVSTYAQRNNEREKAPWQSLRRRRPWGRSPGLLPPRSVLSRASNRSRAKRPIAGALGSWGGPRPAAGPGVGGSGGGGGFPVQGRKAFAPAIAPRGTDRLVASKDPPERWLCTYVCTQVLAPVGARRELGTWEAGLAGGIFGDRGRGTSRINGPLVRAGMRGVAPKKERASRSFSGQSVSLGCPCVFFFLGSPQRGLGCGWASLSRQSISSIGLPHRREVPWNRPPNPPKDVTARPGTFCSVPCYGLVGWLGSHPSTNKHLPIPRQPWRGDRHPDMPFSTRVNLPPEPERP
ncbi:hypothetical protein BDY21DRAFT_112614 [Lineolata rhizophorae]|uniref:Uncharacterized protein n=1 Tax=Lineolata rhizophorae TaxID=578093 RepID=A0A6A6NS48_9PEZI|nr:hypothetical protein BDY21DRAFT_112614 [Lineolata rhizophorae]